MTHTKPNPSKIMHEMLEQLKSENKGMRAELEIHNTINLYIELSETPVSPVELARFRKTFSKLLTRDQSFKVLRDFIDLSSRYAERGRLDGFKDACWT